MNFTRKDSERTIAVLDGDDAYGQMDEHGAIRIQAQPHGTIDDCNATTGWAAVNDATSGLTTDLNHVYGTASLEFDKVNGSGFTEAAIGKTITSVNIDPYHEGGGAITYSIYLSSITDVSYVFIRLGTDSSNYNEWRINDTQLTAGLWELLRFAVMDSHPSGNTGNGWNPEAITYVAVGVEFDGEDDALADIRVDHIAANAGFRTTSDITAEITSEISTPNVNLHKVRNKSINVGSGAAGTTGTMRMILATDDPAVVAIQGPAAVTIDSYDNAPINAPTGATTQIIATPGNNKQLWIYGLVGTADTVDLTITLQSDAVLLSGAMPMADNGGFVLPPSGNWHMPWFKCESNDAFKITTTTGVFDGLVSFAIVSV